MLTFTMIWALALYLLAPAVDEGEVARHFHSLRGELLVEIATLPPAEVVGGPDGWTRLDSLNIVSDWPDEAFRATLVRLGVSRNERVSALASTALSRFPKSDTAPAALRIGPPKISDCEIAAKEARSSFRVLRSLAARLKAEADAPPGHASCTVDEVVALLASPDADIAASATRWLLSRGIALSEVSISAAWGKFDDDDKLVVLRGLVNRPPRFGLQLVKSALEHAMIERADEPDTVLVQLLDTLLYLDSSDARRLVNKSLIERASSPSSDHARLRALLPLLTNSRQSEKTLERCALWLRSPSHGLREDAFEYLKNSDHDRVQVRTLISDLFWRRVHDQSVLGWIVELGLTYKDDSSARCYLSRILIAGARYGSARTHNSGLSASCIAALEEVNNLRLGDDRTTPWPNAPTGINWRISALVNDPPAVDALEALWRIWIIDNCCD